MPEQNRRRTYLINPRFQWRFIGFMATLSLLAISMLFVSNLLFFRNMEREALSWNARPFHGTRGFSRAIAIRSS